MQEEFEVEEFKAEVRGYVVPYDLPSENILTFVEKDEDLEEVKKKKAEMRDYVRAKRVQATGYLHSLGVLATNSVVLVPASRVALIDRVIEEVNTIYNEVNKRLQNEGFEPLGFPVVKKIPMVQTQIVSFKELAQKQLKEKLDRKIEDIATLIQKLQEGVEEAKVKKIGYNLNRTKKEIDNLEKVAQELGIEVDNEFALLSQMIDQAIQVLKGI